MTDVNMILAERRSQHGPFDLHATISQRLKVAMRADNYSESNYPGSLFDSQREALEMIQHKIARILAGNPYHIDHWDDIAGYATLVANILRSQQSTQAPGTAIDVGNTDQPYGGLRGP